MIPALDATSIYAVPLQYHAEGLDAEVLRAFGIEPGADARSRRAGPTSWTGYDNPEGEVTIGVVGKYVGLQDAYKSLNEALVHGGIANRVKVNIHWLDAELFEQPDSDIAAQLEPMHAHPRARRRSASAARRARSPASASRASATCPFSASASACRWPASRARAISPASPRPVSTEFGPTDEPVVGLITEWMSERRPRRSARPAAIWAARCGWAPMTRSSPATALSRRSTAATEISERHRHRYEVNTHYQRRAGKGRAGLLRHVARRHAARDRRAAGPSLVRRRAVPPGTEVASRSIRIRCSRASSRRR